MSDTAGGRRRVIRASEIGEYLYCRRAWWLKAVKGHKSANVRELRAGTQMHQRHGLQVWSARLMQGAAVVLLALAVLAAAWWLLGA